MRHPIIVFAAAVMLLGLGGCGSPPTKSVRTTTTTTTVDDSGNASAVARSELRSNVPVVQHKQIENSRSEWNTTTTPPVTYGSKQTIEQSQSTDIDGTTTVRKRVTNY